jgi:type III secretory pathway component EscS
MIDRTSKILLSLIALGLWANLALYLVHPLPAIAQAQTQTQDRTLQIIARDLAAIAGGNCSNQKIC